jgi:hypothetical protein
MWPRWSRDLRAASRAVRRGAAAPPLPMNPGFVLTAALSLALAWTAAAPAAARERGATAARAGLDVVSSEGETTRVVREVTITRDGIRVESGDRVVVHSDRDRPQVTIRIDGEDTTRHIVITDRHRSGEVVNMFQNVDIPPDRVVNGEVVAIFGNVRVRGTVEGDVVAVMGSVDLGDSARIGGDVVAVGGMVHAPASAEIQGESVSIPLFGQPRWAPWLPLAAGLISLGLFVILGAVVALLFPERLGRVAAMGSRRTFLSLVVGAATFPLLPILVVLLVITVIGIPVALLLLLLYPVAALVGYLAACALIGARFRGRPVTEPPLLPSVLVGVAFVGIFFLAAGALTSLPGGGVTHLIGLILLGVGTIIGSVSVLLGLGALFLSRLGEPERGARDAAGTGSAGVPPMA